MVKTSVKEKKMIPISAAAKFLGVSIDTVRRWDKSGKLHSERLNGKDRYFSLEELEKIKFAKSLSISEAAMELKISPTTLRRLEKKGLISPKRTPSGERIYDRDVISAFLESEYFVRGPEIKKEILEAVEQDESGQKAESETQRFETNIERKDIASNVENNANQIPQIPTQPSERTRLRPNLKPLQRLPEIVVVTMVFLVLVTVGVRNVNVSSHEVLGSSVSREAAVIATPTPSPMPEEEKKPKAIVVIKIDDATSSAFVNIRQKPTVNSEKIGKAQDGDTFEFTSIDSGWYEIKLATGSTGFISEEYVVKEEINK